MLVNEYTKRRRTPPPEMSHKLHRQDQFYGIDPSNVNPFNPPRPALTYQDLNEDVMVAANEGLTDPRIGRTKLLLTIRDAVQGQAIKALKGRVDEDCGRGLLGRVAIVKIHPRHIPPILNLSS